MGELHRSPTVFFSPPQGGGAGGGGVEMRCIGAARMHREDEVSSPEHPQEVRESNRFFLSNMAAYAAKALQRDALCICERRIMLDSRVDLSLRVRKLAIS